MHRFLTLKLASMDLKLAFFISTILFMYMVCFPLQAILMGLVIKVKHK